MCWMMRGGITFACEDVFEDVVMRDDMSMLSGFSLLLDSKIPPTTTSQKHQTRIIWTHRDTWVLCCF